MAVSPDFATFSAAYEAGRAQIVWTSLVADLETPVSAMLKLADEEPMSFLLESVEGGDTRGRYSIIGLRPDLVWRCRGTTAEISRRGAGDGGAFAPCPHPPLSSLRALIAESLIDMPHDLPPMAAGLVGYIGYDMVRLMENLPEVNPDPLGLPDGLFIRPTLMAVFDSVKDLVTIVTPARPQAGMSAAAAYARACERLSDAVSAFDRPLIHEEPPLAEVPPLGETESNMTREEYHAVVRRAKDYIAAGDIFQVVPSQRFRVPFTLPPFSLYRALRRTNPSPYMYFLNFGEFAVVGSSPEILVQLEAGGRVNIRPIAGTRPRGRTPTEDHAIEDELRNDPKERAEHLMLLDLSRNDVGRVAKIGTVRVTDQYFVERYSHVMHLVSHVTGEIDPRHDAIDALAAGFPQGTVSGAPKIRAMEIIDELEPEKRGIYAGGVGYFSAGGSMDTCIVLRTAIVKDGVMYVQAGGGVVADSDPEAEYQETVNKAMALMRAAEEAIRFASTAGRGQ